VLGCEFVRHRQKQLAQRAAEDAAILELAQSRPGLAAAVLLLELAPTIAADSRARGSAGFPQEKETDAPMLRFIVSRLLWMIPSLVALSFLSFVLIQLPPGDYVTTYIATLAASNEVVDQNTAADLRSRFGLDQPIYVQYWKWIYGIVTEGNFGLSFEWQQPVSELIWERMTLTLLLTVSTLILTWGIALPIGVFSAV
jgi:ABC-type microcin C transport system permease subunit YejB